MAGKLLTYKKFQSLEQASELIDILDQNKVAFEVEDNSGNVSDFIVGQIIENNIAIKIHPDNFTKVNVLLNTNAASQIDNVDKDHYLFTFDNEELLEVVSEPDKWCELDKQLAKKLLNERGITINNALEDALYKKRIKELSVEEKGSVIWTTIGYISAFLGGILGLAIGLNLWTSKRTLPDGTRAYIYSAGDRRHGMIITIIGGIMFCTGIYLQIRFHYF
jgi:hypothetical protein